MAIKSNRVFHAVLWDWNGTLLNDNDNAYFFTAVLLPILKGLGVDVSAYTSESGYENLRYVYSILGSSEFIDALAREQNLEIDWQGDVRPQIDPLYYRKKHRLSFGARATLKTLKNDLFVPQAIVSGMPQENLNAEIVSRNIEDLFVGARGGIAHKTALSASFLRFVNCDRDDLRHRVLFVSDVYKDLVEGQNAGLTVVGIPGYGNRESLEEANPFAVVDQIGQVLQLGEFRPRSWS